MMLQGSIVVVSAESDNIALHCVDTRLLESQKLLAAWDLYIRQICVQERNLI